MQNYNAVEDTSFLLQREAVSCLDDFVNLFQTLEKKPTLWW